MSYAQYVFHMLGYFVWPDRCFGSNWPLWFAFQFGFATVAAAIVGDPAAEMWTLLGKPSHSSAQSSPAAAAAAATDAVVANDAANGTNGMNEDVDIDQFVLDGR